MIANPRKDYRKKRRRPNWFALFANAFERRGYDPMGAVVIVFLVGCAIVFAIAVLNHSVARVQGGIWGFSGWVTRAEFFLLFFMGSIIGPILWFAWPMLTRNFLICLGVWFGVPLVLWLSYTAVSAVQAVNVHFDHNPPVSLCAPIIETKKLGCTTIVRLKGSEGRRTVCGVLNRIDGWPRPDSQIWIAGNFRTERSICFTAHAGLLSLPWIGDIHKSD
ncbi:MAG: hypothetical protein ACRECY_09175 [Phyllobacterium sp.]